MKETRELAVKLVTEMLDGFSDNTRKLCATLGKQEALEKVFVPEIRDATGITLNTGMAAITETDPAYIGERRNLARMFGGNTFVGTLNLIQGCCAAGKCHEIRTGDYFEIPVHVPEIEIDGVEFEEINLEKTELTVVHVRDDHVFFNFEDVLLYAAMNQKSTNKGGFKETAMKEYLNGIFLDKVFLGLEDIMQKTGGGFYITLPTKHEVFGQGEYDDFNWPELCPVPFDYFQQRGGKNRIKIREELSKWWWLATPTASIATHFCDVSGSGNANGSGASSSDGGVAPLLCI